MQKIIAVILDENDHLSETKDAGKLSVYHKVEQKWTKQKEVILPDIYEGGMADIRKKLDSVIKELNDCKIIAGKSITGLVYNVFNNAGFIISEIDDFNPAILDGLYSDILKEIDALNTEIASANVPTSPTETEIKGNYFFDFSLLKNSGLSFTSKSTILPFLNSVHFNQLEILSDHVMPWFDLEMKKRNLKYTVAENGNGKSSILVTKTD
jgi:Fe-only nitrogenase accessory protein AnfO